MNRSSYSMELFVVGLGKFLLGWPLWMGIVCFFVNFVYPLITREIGVVPGFFMGTSLSAGFCWIFLLKEVSAGEKGKFGMEHVSAKVHGIVSWILSRGNHRPSTVGKQSSIIETVTLFISMVLMFDPMIIVLFFRCKSEDAPRFVTKDDAVLFCCSLIFCNFIWAFRGILILSVWGYVIQAWRLVQPIFPHCVS